MNLSAANVPVGRSDKAVPVRRIHLVTLIVLGILAWLILAASGMLSVSRPWSGIPVGGQWVRTPLHVDTNALVIDPSQPRTVWAAAANGINRSDDAGFRWQEVAPTLRRTVMVSLAVSHDGRKVLAGSE